MTGKDDKEKCWAMKVSYSQSDTNAVHTPQTVPFYIDFSPRALS